MTLAVNLAFSKLANSTVNNIVYLHQEKKVRRLYNLWKILFYNGPYWNLDYYKEQHWTLPEYVCDTCY